MAKDGSDDNQVGYKKPPRNTRFKKGLSGNPTGRPKGSKSLGARAVSVLETKVSINHGGRTRQTSLLDAIYMQIAKRAASGDIRAAKFLSEAAEAEYARRAEKSNPHRTDPTARDRVRQRIEDIVKKMEAGAKPLPDGEGSEGH